MDVANRFGPHRHVGATHVAGGEKEIEVLATI
jgi:hypothetical protein